MATRGGNRGGSALTGAVDPERAARQAEMLAGRVKKTFRRLHPAFEQKSIGAFRLYDRDIPEIRAVIDWYEGHLVMGEYQRRQTETAGDWLYVMGAAAGEALAVPPAHIHLKRRRTRPKAGHRYPESNGSGRGPSRLSVRERDLRFRVNLDDYLDTGLFPDHRETRQRIRKEAQGRSILNLFSYTGTFSAAALAGGAKHVTSVEHSKVYVDWAKTNLSDNNLPLHRHEPVRGEVFEFLRHAADHGRRWEVVVVDPPSFSTVGGARGQGIDLAIDHPDLLRLALSVTAPEGRLYFSTNHQRFEPEFAGLARQATEITSDTVPVDYRNPQIHRAWLFQ